MDALTAGVVDGFLQGYLAGAPDAARAYCEIDAEIVRKILGVAVEDIDPDRRLVESCGCCYVRGIGYVTGGLAILYHSPELGDHTVMILATPAMLPVTEPTIDDPPL